MGADAETPVSPSVGELKTTSPGSFGAGACMVMVFATLSSLVQLNAPNEMRGRVMSIYMVAFRGGMPVGSLVAGWAATWSSAPTVLMVNGTLITLVAAWFLLMMSHGVREL